MILYLDSSAIVKQYVVELGSSEVFDAVGQSEMNGTAVASRVEVVAAFRKAVRTGVLSQKEAKILVRNFNRDWHSLVRTRVTERLVLHASDLAWVHGLRGYDAIHLASAAAWQQALGQMVTIATFDQALWSAARMIGLTAFPFDLPTLIKTWRRLGARSG